MMDDPFGAQTDDSRRSPSVPAFNFGSGDSEGADTGSAPQTGNPPVPMFNLGGGDAASRNAVDERRDELASRINIIRDTVNRVPGASRRRLSDAPDFAAQMDEARRKTQTQEQAPLALDVPGDDISAGGAKRYDAFYSTPAGAKFRERFGGIADKMISDSEAAMNRALGLA